MDEKTINQLKKFHEEFLQKAIQSGASTFVLYDEEMKILDALLTHYFENEENKIANIEKSKRQPNAQPKPA